MSQVFKKFFLDEKIILCFIILNGVIIYLQESGLDNILVSSLDILCTIIFIVEMAVKHVELGIRGYWKDGWNRLDGILVLLSIPSVIAFFVPASVMLQHLGVLFALRMLRVLRFLRVLHFFPNFTVIMHNFGKALRESYGVFFGLLIFIVIFALISCNLFGDTAPGYFDTPANAIYSIFRICTGEGWNEIPDAIAANSTTFTAAMVRIYFSVVLIICSIIGLSLVNSIFVDAMVSDNDYGVKQQLDEIGKKLDKLMEEQKYKGGGSEVEPE